MRTTLYLLLLLLCLPLSSSRAQDAGVPTEEAPAPALRPVSDQQWRDASGRLDYSDDLPKEEKKREPQYEPRSTHSARDWTWNTGFWGNALQILAIALAVGLIGFGIYKMLQQPRNRALSRDGVEITLDNIEEYLHETDLERFLRAALADKNYALAIRLYYLQVIKDLSAKGAIHWAREKTNRDYLREMQSQPQSEAFRSATRNYERVWYGNLILTESAFRTLEPEFKKLTTRG